MIQKWYLFNMKLITRDTDYAIRAVTQIASCGGRIVAVPELVKELKMPRPFLRKVLQRLHSSGLLAATRGKGGGFMLKKRPSSIYIVDIIRAFQGPFHLNECMFKKRICPNRGMCLLRKKICSIEKTVLKELSSVTIASIM